MNALIRLKRVLQSDCNYNKRSDLFLWHSDILKVDNKPFILRDWYVKGVSYVSDIIDNEGHFLNLNSFHETFNVKNKFFKILWNLPGN